MGEGGGGEDWVFQPFFISSWTIRTSNIMLIAHFLKKKVLCPGRTSRAAQGYGPCFVFMAHVSTSLPTEVANKVRKLIEETKNGKVVSGMAQMIEFLKANGLAREAVDPSISGRGSHGKPGWARTQSYADALTAAWHYRGRLLVCPHKPNLHWNVRRRAGANGRVQ